MNVTHTKKFSKMSHGEALLDAETRETWLVEGLIGATSTLVYGEAKVGKSFLMSALVAALVSGDDFLGRQVPHDREFSVAVCWTDDGGAGDYATQIEGVLPEGIAVKVEYFGLPVMASTNDWHDLFDEVMASGHNVVVVDNLTQCLNGSINQDDVVRAFFDGIRLFIRASIPVVIVGHSTEKAGPNGHRSDKPMGSSVISQSVRWRCFVKRNRKGNLTLSFSGNYAEPHEMTLKHGAGARFEIVNTKDAEAVASEADNRKQQRDAKTLNTNREMAEWVTENCQGLGVNAAARAIVDSGIFPAMKFETVRSRVKSAGPVGKMLDRTGDNEATHWTMAGG